MSRLLLHVFPSFAVGGAQMRFAALAGGAGRGFRHAVVALDGDTGCAAHLPAGLDVSFPTAPRGLPAIRAALRGLAPDLLVTSNWGSMDWVAANLGGRVPHLHMEDGFGPEERSAQLRRRVLARRFLLRRSTVAVPSHTLLRLARDTWRLDPARLRYIPNGVDLVRFAPAPRPAGDALVVGTVAALRPEKNVARLLRAFRALLAAGPARLLVAGDGPERGRLEALAAELGIAEATRFLGATSRPEAVYRELDVFALASDTEQMPLSLMEAMASGLPAVATDVGDVRAMVAPENHALLAAPEDAAFTQALLLAASAAERRRAAGEANRAQAVALFGGAPMQEAYGALFDSMAGVDRRVAA